MSEEIARANIILNIKGDLEKTIGQVDRLGESSKRTSSGLSGVGDVIKSLATKAAVAVGAIGAIGYGLKKLVTPASDFVEANNRMKVVFKDIGEDAAKVLGKLRSEYHLSKLAATEFLGGIGDILTGFGLNQAAALELSDQVVRLATDLSSFANVPVEQAVNALTKSFTGQREELKRLGITIDEDLVKKQAVIEKNNLLNKGFLGTQEELERTAKAYASINISVEQSENAIGDFNRSMGESLPNQLKKAKATLSDVVVDIGEVFLPAVLNATKKLNELLATDLERKSSRIDTSIGRLLRARERGDEGAIRSYTNSINRQIKAAELSVKRFKFDRGFGFKTPAFTETGVSKFISERTQALEEAQSRMEEMRESGIAIITNTDFNKLKGSIDLYVADIERANQALADLESNRSIVERGRSALFGDTSESILGDIESSNSSDVVALQNADKKISNNILNIMRQAGKSKEQIRREELSSYADYVTRLKDLDSDYVVLLSDNDRKIRESADSILNTISNLIKDIDSESNKTALENFANKFVETFNQIADMVSNALRTVGDVFNTFYDSQIDNIERRYAVERALLEAKTEEELALQDFNREREEEEFQRKYNMRQQEFLDMDKERQDDFVKKQGLDEQEKLRELASIKSREEADKKIAKLEADKDKRIMAIKRKQFNMNKSASIGQIIIDTAAAVVGFLKNPGGFLGIGLSASAGAIGAAQLGIALGQPNPYRSYRWGGLVGEGGAMAKGETFFRAGEGTGAEAVLPAPLTSFLMDAAKKWDQAPAVTETTNNEIIVNIHNPINAEEVVEAIREQTGRRLL